MLLIFETKRIKINAYENENTGDVMTPSQSISCQLDDDEKLALQLVAQWYEFPSVAQLVRFTLEEMCGPAWLKATECVRNGEFTRPEKHPGRPPKHTRIPNA